MTPIDRDILALDCAHHKASLMANVNAILANLWWPIVGPRTEEQYLERAMPAARHSMALGKMAGIALEARDLAIEMRKDEKQ